MEYNIYKSTGQNGLFQLVLSENTFNFYNNGGYEYRNESTIKLLIEALKMHEQLFYNKTLNVTVNTSDHIFTDCLNYAHTTNKYLTIPDFTFDQWPQVGIQSFNTTVLNILDQHNVDSIYNSVFWSGSVGNIKQRNIYQALSATNHRFICNEIHWNKTDSIAMAADNYVSIPDHCKYKYLLDLQGHGWSARLKFLLYSNRLVFIAKRPQLEWWMHHLQDKVNCVLVESDLSNLNELVNYYDNNPEEYKTIVTNQLKFANLYFNKQSINKHIIDTLIKFL